MIAKPDEGSRDIPYPLGRRLTFDVGKLGLRRLHVKALLEVDITDARRKIRERRRTGVRCSFTAWFIEVVADTVARYPLVAGINDPRHNRVRILDHGNIAVVIEKEVNGAVFGSEDGTRAGQNDARSATMVPVMPSVITATRHQWS